MKLENNNSKVSKNKFNDSIKIIAFFVCLVRMSRYSNGTQVHVLCTVLWYGVPLSVVAIIL